MVGGGSEQLRRRLRASIRPDLPNQFVHGADAADGAAAAGSGGIS